MNTELTKDQLTAVKRSYLNVLAFFLEHENLESRYLKCLLKWGFQLHLNQNDLTQENVDVSNLAFKEPREKIESIYHLVYMIYLDRVVEDVELEVATLYSERLGYKPEIVSELFKSIATEDYDSAGPRSLQAEIEEFMKIHNP